MCGNYCPLCGSSALIRNTTGCYCLCCEHYTDIDEVTEHDRS